MAKIAVGYRPEMIYLAVCCGGTMISHVNDAGFWIVNQYFGMTVAQSLKTWSTAKFIVAIFGMGIIMVGSGGDRMTKRRDFHFYDGSRCGPGRARTDARVRAVRVPTS